MALCSSPAAPASSARTSFTTRSSTPPTGVVVVDKLTYAGSLLNLERPLDGSARHVRPGGHRRSRARWRSVFARAPARRGPESRRRDARRSVDRRSRAVHRHEHRRHVRAARGARGTFVASCSAGGARGVPLPARLDRRGVRHARRRAGCSARRRRTRRTRRTRRARRRPIIWCAPTSTPTACRSLITNCSNNYGPYQFPEKLIPLMILNALDGRPLPIYGDGGNVRDWLHVEDHCAGLLLVLANGRAGREVQHRRRQRADQPARSSIGSATRSTSCGPPRRIRRCSGAASYRDAQDVRARSAGPRSALRDRRDEDPPRARLARRATTFESGLRETVRWYLEHRDWCERRAGRAGTIGERLGLGTISVSHDDSRS